LSTSAPRSAHGSPEKSRQVAPCGTISPESASDIRVRVNLSTGPPLVHPLRGEASPSLEHVDPLKKLRQNLGMQASEHRALICWSASRTQRGLPNTLRYVHGIRFTEGPPPWPDETWSLVCTFDISPSQQGNPSTARVRFLVDTAPHDRLKPGLKCWLYEGATQAAVVEVID